MRVFITAGELTSLGETDQYVVASERSSEDNKIQMNYFI